MLASSGLLASLQLNMPYLRGQIYKFEPVVTSVKRFMWLVVAVTILFKCLTRLSHYCPAFVANLFLAPQLLVENRLAYRHLLLCTQYKKACQSIDLSINWIVAQLTCCSIDLSLNWLVAQLTCCSIDLLLNWLVAHIGNDIICKFCKLV